MEPQRKEFKKLEPMHVVSLPMMHCFGHCVLPSAAIPQLHSPSSVGPSPTGRYELSALPFPRPMDILEVRSESSGPQGPQFPWGSNRESMLLHLLAILEALFTTTPSESTEGHSYPQIYHSTLLTQNHFLLSQSFPARL